MCGAAFFGLSLISGSKLAFSLAVVSTLSHWWFLSNVENPHMRKLYGDSLRKEAGLTKTIKNVALKNARRIKKSTAGMKHGEKVSQVAQEVRGTFEKVYGDAAEVMEEFIARSRPKLQEVVQSAEDLVKQSRERLIIPRVSSDLSAFDASKYIISVFPSVFDESGPLRFHLGEPITIKWQAPVHHSRRDWIGIYRIGANKSQTITNVNSLGMWAPVHDEEWDGDVPLGLHRTAPPGKEIDSGEVIFKGETLPWQPGKYEIRYHHDGKYNVMSMLAPVEIYIDIPETFTSETVRATLLRIITFGLDSDPELLPRSAMGDGTPKSSSPSREGQPSHSGDPDDFRFWNPRQAKRIAVSIKETFGVDYAPEVILGDANVTTLTNRILDSKEIWEHRW